MSAHYAMCKYDDATGSYIPLEVRPITDTLKKDDPLYQEGFHAGEESVRKALMDGDTYGYGVRVGAASRDAEIADLTKQRDEEAKDSAQVIIEREELRAQVLAQQARIELYEQALLASWPKGAMGDAFDYWNAARGASTTPDKKRAILEAATTVAAKIGGYSE